MRGAIFFVNYHSRTYPKPACPLTSHSILSPYSRRMPLPPPSQLEAELLSPTLREEAAALLQIDAEATLLSPEVGIEDHTNDYGRGSSSGDIQRHRPRDRSLGDNASVELTLRPFSERTPYLSVSGSAEPRVSPYRHDDIYHCADPETQFSIRELEEIYLARRSRELNIEVGKQEEELGRHLTACMKVINILKGLHQEVYSVRSRQALLSNGASTERPFEYEHEMQQRITNFHSPTTLSDSRHSHQPSPSPIARKLRLIGHTFYAYPSLLSSSFNRLWNELWSRA